MRKKIVAGNWKMHHSYHEAVACFATLYEHREEFPAGVEVIVFPPDLYIREFSKKLHLSDHLSVGAQNCFYQTEGAFTGEISPAMLKSVGAKYCIVGHSERRTLFGETDEIVMKKVHSAINVSLSVVLCCGEPLEVREDQSHFAWVERQIKAALFDLDEEQIKKVIIAYEPVWAIGTGKTASVEQAQEMHQFIRTLVAEKFGTDIADSVCILYGGSCNPENAPLLFAAPDVDGGLIGGASLKLSTFLPVIKAARS